MAANTERSLTQASCHNEPQQKQDPDTIMKKAFNSAENIKRAGIANKYFQTLLERRIQSKNNVILKKHEPPNLNISRNSQRRNQVNTAS